jgi:hypothetical protein
VTYAPTAVVPRAGWRAADPITARLALRAPADTWVGATWHHSTGTQLGSPNSAAWVREIQAYHQGTLGYGDIAYSALIDAAGRVFEGRDRKYVGAHAASAGNVANRRTHGVCFLGDLTYSGPTVAAQHAALWVLETMRYVGDGLYCWEHREWLQYGPPAKPTACPGNHGAAFVAGTLRPYAAHLATT